MHISTGVQHVDTESLEDIDDVHVVLIFQDTVDIDARKYGIRNLFIMMRRGDGASGLWVGGVVCLVVVRPCDSASRSLP